MATDIIRNLPLSRSHGHSLGIMSAGTTFFVLNSDSKTASTDFDDPPQCVANGAAPEAKIYIHAIPSEYTVLDLYHNFIGANPVTALVVRIYGLVPIERNPRNRLIPFDIDAVNFGDHNVQSPAGLWIPLPEVGTGTVSQTFDNNPEISVDSVAPNYKLSPKKTLSLLGVSSIMGVIQTACDTITAGMVIGRLGN